MNPARTIGSVCGIISVAMALYLMFLVERTSDPTFNLPPVGVIGAPCVGLLTAAAAAGLASRWWLILLVLWLTLIGLALFVINRPWGTLI